MRKWLARFRRDGWAGPENRSSTPHLVASKLPAPWLTMIARLRREDRMTGEEIALRRLPRSTVASHLRRLGLGRLAALEPSAPARRYSRARAGELVHLDIKKLAASAASDTGSPVIAARAPRVRRGISSTSRSTTPRA